MKYTNVKELALLEELVKPVLQQQKYVVYQTLYLLNGKPEPVRCVERGSVICWQAFLRLGEAYQQGRLYFADA